MDLLLYVCFLWARTACSILSATPYSLCICKKILYLLLATLAHRLTWSLVTRCSSCSLSLDSAATRFMAAMKRVSSCRQASRLSGGERIASPVIVVPSRFAVVVVDSLIFVGVLRLSTKVRLSESAVMSSSQLIEPADWSRSADCGWTNSAGRSADEDSCPSWTKESLVLADDFWEDRFTWDKGIHNKG